jgi:hypothetical protein
VKRTFATRLRQNNTAYFDAGFDAGGQKMVDLFCVAAYECGFIRTPAKAKQLFDKMHELEREYGAAWQGKAESDDAIARIDYVLKKLFGENFQPFFARNDLIKDWWEGKCGGK